MGKKVFILVEGIADLVFIRDFIKAHYCYNCDIKMNSKVKEIILEKEESKIMIFCIDGKDPDKNQKQIMEQKHQKFNADDILVIFDADQDLNEARKNIKNICQFKNIEEKQMFLFPNNEDKGGLECFIEKIVVEESVLKCWETFEQCVSKIDENFTIPAKKSKIHTYLEVLNPDNKKGKDNCKEINRDYTDTKKWKIDDLDIECVKKFKDFLDVFIK